MAMYKRAGSGKTNLISYLQYQASTLRKVPKCHQGRKKTESPWYYSHSSYSYSVIFHIFFTVQHFPISPQPGCIGATQPGVAMGAMPAPGNRGARKNLCRRNIQISSMFCLCSHIRLESAHNRSYVILMSFLLWVTEKNLSVLFCYLLGV